MTTDEDGLQWLREKVAGKEARREALLDHQRDIVKELAEESRILEAMRVTLVQVSPPVVADSVFVVPVAKDAAERGRFHLPKKYGDLLADDGRVNLVLNEQGHKRSVVGVIRRYEARNGMATIQVGTALKDYFARRPTGGKIRFKILGLREIEITVVSEDDG